jgi:hypothetical protein
MRFYVISLIDCGGMGAGGATGSFKFQRPFYTNRTSAGGLIYEEWVVAPADDRNLTVGLALPEGSAQWTPSDTDTVWHFFVSSSAGLNAAAIVRRLQGAVEPRLGLARWLVGSLYNVPSSPTGVGQVDSCMCSTVYTPPVALGNGTAACHANFSTVVTTPVGTAAGDAYQVCTNVTVKAVQPKALELCLATTNEPPQCKGSAASGRLGAIFLSRAALRTSGSLNFVERDFSITSVCTNSSLLSCGGKSLAGVTQPGSYDIALLVDQDFTLPTDTLGCLWITSTSPLTFEPPAGGWSVGLYYTTTDGTAVTRMAGQVCGPPVVSIDLSGNASAIPWPLTKNFPRWPSSTIPCTGVSVTQVERRMVRVDLSIVSCRKLPRSGNWAGIFLNSSALGVRDARELVALSSASLKVLPYGFCSWTSGRATPLVTCTQGVSTGARTLNLLPRDQQILGATLDDEQLDFDLAVIFDPVRWISTGSSLSFYISGTGNLSLPSANGWHVAVRHDNLNGVATSSAVVTGQAFQLGKRRLADGHKLLGRRLAMEEEADEHVDV